jgi:hypothetical protein
LLKLHEKGLQLLKTETETSQPLDSSELERRVYAAIGAAILNLDCVLTK